MPQERGEEDNKSADHLRRRDGGVGAAAVDVGHEEEAVGGATADRVPGRPRERGRVRRDGRVRRLPRAVDAELQL